MLEKTEYIFIAEVSMMELKFYRLFCLIKSAFPSMKFIIAGDGNSFIIHYSTSSR